MSEKQKQILEVFETILPKMSVENQSYLLGYGEGVAAAMEQNKNKDRQEVGAERR